MGELAGEDVHSGGLIEVGTTQDDPASLAMGFEGTGLRRLWHDAEYAGAPRRPAGYEIVFDNEDDDPLTGDLYAIYRINDPLLKARGEVLFAGRVKVVDESGPVILRSQGNPDVEPHLL